MRGSRRTVSIWALLLLLGASLAVPFSSAQVFASDYCPSGDQAHGPPDPPGDDADRAHVDLEPTGVSLRSLDGQDVVERGIYFVTRSAGMVEVEVTVKNVGNMDSPASDVRLTLHRTGGSSTAKTVDTSAIPAGVTVKVKATFTLQSGHHVLDVHVNPDADPGESCQDARPNNDCGSVADPCSYTYYGNNRMDVGIVAGALPALRVEKIEASTPQRATYEASPESESQVKLTVRNTGSTAAFNLLGHPDDAPPFTARLVVEDCTCPWVDVNVTTIPAGATRVVEATIPVHGARGEFTLKARLDEYGETADLDRAQGQGKATFHVPTPDVRARVVSAHEELGETLLVPDGEAVSFQVVVENVGDAEASTLEDDGVRIIVERDRSGNIVKDTRRVVPAGESVTVAFSEPIDEDHTYRVRVDPGDEVLELSKTGNTRYVPVRVARHAFSLDLDRSDPEIMVPPGADASLSFTLHNEGTVTDTYRLQAPAGAHFEDMQGDRLEKAEVEDGTQARLKLVRPVSRDAAKGERFPVTLKVVSDRSGDSAERNVTFVVGEDTMPPGIRLQEPASGFLGGDRIVLEVTDNVGVASVETDLFGSFQPVAPDERGGSLYTLDATGTPDGFMLSVRARDKAENVGKGNFTLTRDNEKPRIQRVTFTPASSVRPGDGVALIVVAYDDHMERVDVRVSQPRPGGEVYMENHTIQGAGPEYILRDWVVPERPGHYVFNVTAVDKAGNEKHREKRLYIEGLDIEVLTVQPGVSPSAPKEGDRVTFTYQIRNSSPRFETGEFFVTFVVDFRRQIGLHRMNLGPDEARVVQFTWTAEPGAHGFTMVVDQADEVAEDNPEDESNLHFTETRILFPDQPLFAPESVQVRYTETFGQLIRTYFYIPLLLVVPLGLFSTTFVLQRRKKE